VANPKADYDSEWVEIYNGSAASVDLDGWKVDDGEGGSSSYIVPAGSIVAPGGYLVLDLSSGLLNNDGDSIRLIRPDGIVADTTSYTSSAVDTSRCRAPDGSWYDGEQPTPGAANIPLSALAAATDVPPSTSVARSPSRSAPSSIPSDIRLSEVLALPKDAYDAEWVEIANDSSVPADLSGWRVDDVEDGSSPYTLPAGSTIGPQGFLAVIMPHALFNNTGDSVRLIRPDGLVADAFDYAAAAADLSVCLIEGSWVPECSPTPGAPNQLAADDAEPSAGDASAKPPTDISVASQTSPASSDPAETAAATTTAVLAAHRPVSLQSAGSSQFVYALALPGSVYLGVVARTPTPRPSEPPAPAPRFSTMAIHRDTPAPTSSPIRPIAAGLLIVLGIIVAGYERVRSQRSTTDTAELCPTPAGAD
jgi:hypothetical protein